MVCGRNVNFFPIFKTLSTNTAITSMERSLSKRALRVIVQMMTMTPQRRPMSAQRISRPTVADRDSIMFIQIRVTNIKLRMRQNTFSPKLVSPTAFTVRSCRNHCSKIPHVSLVAVTCCTLPECLHRVPRLIRRSIPRRSAVATPFPRHFVRRARLSTNFIFGFPNSNGPGAKDE